MIADFLIGFSIGGLIFLFVGVEIGLAASRKIIASSCSEKGEGQAKT